jgi:hypothetical protein
VARTDEQLDFAKRLETLIRPVLGERVRLVPDAEGFPIVPGVMGRIEYLGTRTGPDRDGTRYSERLHVFTDHGRIIPKLLAVPGVHHAQMGDGEARLWFAPDDASALAAVARIIRPRMRRAPSTGNPAALARLRAAKDIKARRAHQTSASLRGRPATYPPLESHPSPGPLTSLGYDQLATATGATAPRTSRRRHEIMAWEPAAAAMGHRPAFTSHVADVCDTLRAEHDCRPRARDERASARETGRKSR